MWEHERLWYVEYLPFFEAKCRKFVGIVGKRVEADVRETSPFAFGDFYLKMAGCLLFRCLFSLKDLWHRGGSS